VLLKKIDEFMEKRIIQVKCAKCNGELKQLRKGSFVGICTNCGAKFTLGKRRK
jgi:ribosomal protein L37AE/L43A